MKIVVAVFLLSGIGWGQSVSKAKLHPAHRAHHHKARVKAETKVQNRHLFTVLPGQSIPSLPVAVGPHLYNYPLPISPLPISAFQIAVHDGFSGFHPVPPSVFQDAQVPPSEEISVPEKDVSILGFVFENGVLRGPEIGDGSSRVILLMEDDLARLAIARAEVENYTAVHLWDIERTIAKNHGARLDTAMDCLDAQRGMITKELDSTCKVSDYPNKRDTIKFYGDFLLINVPEAK